MTVSLSESYRLCRLASRRAASNFYVSILLLPPDKQSAMHALYAFLRKSDDLGDGDEPMEARRQSLAAWRVELRRALEDRSDDPHLPALVDAVRTYQIPERLLFDVLDGVEMDLDRFRYETFADLEVYCHRVATAVGLCCIRIWGLAGRQSFSDPSVIDAAQNCGLAFQLTNVLRDLKEDAARGRIYLPLEDLRACGYAESELLAGVRDERLDRLVRLEVRRADEFFAQGASLGPRLCDDGRRVLGAMLDTYGALLEKIDRAGGEVLDRRVRVGQWKKMRIAARWSTARV